MGTGTHLVTKALQLVAKNNSVIMQDQQGRECVPYHPGSTNAALFILYDAYRHTEIKRRVLGFTFQTGLAFQKQSKPKPSWGFHGRCCLENLTPEVAGLERMGSTLSESQFQV